MRIIFTVVSTVALFGSHGCGHAAEADGAVLEGKAAFGDWRADKPGVRRHITAADLPKPFATRSVSNPPDNLAAGTDQTPKVPPGFKVERFASGFENPRLMRVAPNGDIFLSDTTAGVVHVMRAGDGAAKPEKIAVFADSLQLPFGIAFYPPGPEPQWVYVATTQSILRYPYRSGDLKPRGPAQTVVSRLTKTSGGHVTRDIQFSSDGARMFVSVGSGSNVGDGMEPIGLAEAKRWDKEHGLGATWGDEEDRADVLVFDSDGRGRKVYASGIRNCSGLAVNTDTQDVWCATNERDGLGENLVPDYVTRVRQGAFYGWPWYYVEDREDPRRKGERPDLAGKATLPDVLIQPHSAPLQMTFYPSGSAGSAAFPADYAGQAFVALHGSWNRQRRTGYKIVRLVLNKGEPTGVYEDFLTGFVTDDAGVWGRPVGVAVAHDGALLVSDDGSGCVWRISYENRRSAQ